MNGNEQVEMPANSIHSPSPPPLFPSYSRISISEMESTLYKSPSMSPSNYGVGVGGFDSASELIGAMKGLHMGSCGGGKVVSPRCWGFQLGCSPRSGFGSPRTGSGLGSVPSTPNRLGSVVSVSRVGGLFDTLNLSPEEEPVTERVESGRDIRAMMYAKLRRENSLGRAESPCSLPDLGWVSELVK